MQFIQQSTLLWVVSNHCDGNTVLLEWLFHVGDSSQGHPANTDRALSGRLLSSRLL
jgi:hypothetical protein